MDNRSPPNQERIWDAFGHAMGAALGLELVLRLAVFEKKAMALYQRGPDSQGFGRKRKAIINGMTEGTFGQVANNFRQNYPNLVTPLFDEALSNALLFRNRLGHRFLVHHLRNLRTEQGLDLIAIECALYRNHFQSLEEHIRQKVAIDWVALENVTQPKPDDPRHPLEGWLEEARPAWELPEERR